MLFKVFLFFEHTLSLSLSFSPAFVVFAVVVIIFVYADKVVVAVVALADVVGIILYALVFET